ncbi:hypothetical protein AWENTII_010285 [Aspergillus wentii]
MKYWSALALFTSLPLALSASETPAAKIVSGPIHRQIRTMLTRTEIDLRVQRYTCSLRVAVGDAHKLQGQTPQKNAGGWGCIQTSSICEADKDQSTLHEDPKTGDWVCCDKVQIFQDGACAKPAGMSSSKSRKSTVH